jgi:fructose-1,6-bisphosphatase I
MAFVIEQAGGRASDGRRRILDLDVEELHQRAPIFIGSTEMVLLAERFMKDAGVLSFKEADPVHSF